MPEPALTTTSAAPTDSTRPSAKRRHVHADAEGLSLSWRNVIVAALVVLGGGGGYTGFQLVTQGELDQRLAEQSKETASGQQALKVTVDQHTEAIRDLGGKVDSVQTTQREDIAHREAIRVVDEATPCTRGDERCLIRRTEERERIRRLNLARLKVNMQPCASIRCE